MAVGIAAAAAALVLMPSTIQTERMIELTSIGSRIGSGSFDATYNLPRAQLRELVLLAGGFLFVGGCMLYGAGAVVAAVARRQLGTDASPSADATTPQVSEPAASALVDFPDAQEPNGDERKWVIIMAIAIGLIIVFVVGLAATQSIRSPAINQQISDEMMADNIEAQADNLEAMADNAAAESERLLSQ